MLTFVSALRIQISLSNNQCKIHGPHDELLDFLIALPPKFEDNKVEVSIKDDGDESKFDIDTFCFSLALKTKIRFSCFDFEARPD